MDFQQVVEEEIEKTRRLCSNVTISLSSYAVIDEDDCLVTGT
jgi:hypothetical protein